MERFYTFVFVAGLGCFLIAGVLGMVFPWMSLQDYHGMEYRTLEQLAEEPSQSFQQFSASFPEAFEEAFGTSEATPQAYADALQLGRDIYVGQACWHCHSQYVREVSNEEQRFGPPGIAQQYQNALNQPHLWGTRRVGPDLSREFGLHTNDWHIAHFIQPKNVVANSVMPPYAFYFEEDGTPKRKGFALITYIQWLGSEYARLAEAGLTE